MRGCRILKRRDCHGSKDLTVGSSVGSIRLCNGPTDTILRYSGYNFFGASKPQPGRYLALAFHSKSNFSSS
jgi:hypothetical protein